MKQIDIFENISLFFGLNDDERDILRKVAVKKTFPKNTILFSAFNIIKGLLKRLRGADKKIESLALKAAREP